MLALLTVILAWQDPEPLPVSDAFVVEVRGTVTLLRRKKPLTKIDRSEFLFEHDIITLGSNGSAKVVQRYARVEDLEPSARKEIKKLSPASGQGIVDADKYAEMAGTMARARQNRSKRSPGKMSGPDDLAVTALAPRNSLVMDDRPTFEWTPVKGAKNYVLEIFDARQVSPLFHATAKEPRVTYPDPSQNKSIKQLLPGEYTWEVTADIDQRHKVLDAARFTIATPAQADAARRALTSALESSPKNGGANVLYILAAFEHHLYPAAEAELKRALRGAPDDETLWELLMQAYQEMKRPEDRNRVFDYLKDRKASDRERILATDAHSATKPGSSTPPQE